MAGALPLAPMEPPPDEPRFLISDLCRDLEAYLPPEQIREVYRAYLYSAEAHEGQQRKSGEPYIFHPVAVARILAELRMDYRCLMAAVLHDVIEDTGVSRESLVQEFGDEVARLVDAVTKLTRIDFETRAEAQAASMHKMLLAMTKDVRVMLIKLADRLHNMRTLDAFGRPKVRRIARETLEIYAPIAFRLGINSVRVELEDLGFAHYWPWRQHILAAAVARARGSRTEFVAKIVTTIRDRLYLDDLPGQVEGRQKHLYSIYLKMRDKTLPFREVMDVYGFRIIVDRVDSCYRALGLVHNLFKPVPGRFKDYIAIPKSNGYQSLHTILVGPGGVHMEIQIRTLEMHRTAESGVAAHWVYKRTGEGDGQGRASIWLKNLRDLQTNTGDSVEFLDNVKFDLFPDEVYVFTPRGRILVLPKGASVVDFAYAVHSELGNSCVSARIDRRLVPLRTKLHSGQTVEILTAQDARPKPEWLAFVVTGKARANIRSYLKNIQTQEATQLGRTWIEKELAVYNLSLDELDPAVLANVLKEIRLPSLAALLAEIGLGTRPPMLVARRLAGERPDERRISQAAGPMAIQGTEGQVVTYAPCCRPVVGDPVVGILTAGEGLWVHRHGCRELGDLSQVGRAWLEPNWEPGVQLELPTEIRMDVLNELGALATVATTIAGLGSNIEDVATEHREGHISTMIFLIQARDRRHLAAIMRQLHSLPAVLRIQRGGL